MQASRAMNRFLGSAAGLLVPGFLGVLAHPPVAADQPPLQSIVMLGGGAAGAAAPAPQTAAAGGGAAGARELRAIDFRRGADNAGRVIVKLSDPHIHINLHQIGNQVVVEFSDASVPANLLRRYDATDFGTPISSFDVTRVGNGSLIAITTNGDYAQLAYQADDQYVIEVAPRRKTANVQAA